MGVAGFEAAGVQVTVGGAGRQVRRLLRFAAALDGLNAGPILAAASRPDHDALAVRPAARPTAVQGGGMTARIGWPPHAAEPRRPVGTIDVLAAVAGLGPSWPARFGNHKIIDVTAALDRERKGGSVLDAVSLTPRQTDARPVAVTGTRP